MQDTLSLTSHVQSNKGVKKEATQGEKGEWGMREAAKAFTEPQNSLVNAPLQKKNQANLNQLAHL